MVGAITTAIVAIHTVLKANNVSKLFAHVPFCKHFWNFGDSLGTPPRRSYRRPWWSPVQRIPGQHTQSNFPFKHTFSFGRTAARLKMHFPPPSPIEPNSIIVFSKLLQHARLCVSMLRGSFVLSANPELKIMHLFFLFKLILFFLWFWYSWHALGNLVRSVSSEKIAFD